MITFKLSDIPLGVSDEELTLEPARLDLGIYEFGGGWLHVHFERGSDLLRVQFRIATRFTLICDRSLEPFPYDVDEDYMVIFRIGGEDIREDEEIAYRPLDPNRDLLDITQEVRDTILLSVPAKKLHPKYLDEFGEPTDFSAIFPEKETTDPRWDALKDLKKDV